MTIGYRGSSVTSSIRRAGAYALVGTLSIAAPAVGRGTVVLFAAVAAASLFVIEDGRLFELFARPTDRDNEQRGRRHRCEEDDCHAPDGRGRDRERSEERVRPSPSDARSHAAASIPEGLLTLPKPP